MEEIVNQLRSLGADIEASQYLPEDKENYVNAVKGFVRSMDFMRLGQAINHKQWQAAAMKINKMSAEARQLGMTRWERPFAGIRQNINRRNQPEALQILATIVAMRVKMMELLGIK